MLLALPLALALVLIALVPPDKALATSAWLLGQAFLSMLLCFLQ